MNSESFEKAQMINNTKKWSHLVGKKFNINKFESLEGNAPLPSTHCDDLPSKFRVLKPDSLKTMDFNTERLNIHLDDKDVVNRHKHKFKNQESFFHKEFCPKDCSEKFNKNSQHVLDYSPYTQGSKKSVSEMLLEKEDLHTNINKRNITYSFEFFAPKSDKGMKNLLQTITDMGELNPIFIDCTWSNSGTTCQKTKHICEYINNVLKIPACMHLTCSNLTLSEIDAAIDFCLEKKILKILALRGDEIQSNDAESEEGNCCIKSALELVRYIEQKSNNKISIGIAGYPEQHPDSKGIDKDILYLKEKIKSGAKFIITQLFYDVDYFGEFLKNCEVYELDKGTVIIPGILPITNYKQFKNIISLCKIKVPVALMQRIEENKEHNDRIEQIGVEYCVEMCKALNHRFGVNHFHFYTLNNKSQTVKVLEDLGWINTKSKSIQDFTNSPTIYNKEDIIHRENIKTFIL